MFMTEWFYLSRNIPPYKSLSISSEYHSENNVRCLVSILTFFCLMEGTHEACVGSLVSQPGIELWTISVWVGVLSLTSRNFSMICFTISYIKSLSFEFWFRGDSEVYWSRKRRRTKFKERGEFSSWRVWFKGRKEKKLGGECGGPRQRGRSGFYSGSACVSLKKELQLETSSV